MALRAFPSTCHDCGGALRKVTLFTGGPVQGQDELHFSNAESRTILLHLFPKDGSVRAFRCIECGRISLYGVTDADTAHEAEAFNCLECGTRIESGQQTCPNCGWTYE